jgi:hypothetical protein
MKLLRPRVLARTLLSLGLLFVAAVTVPLSAATARADQKVESWNLFCDQCASDTYNVVVYSCDFEDAATVGDTRWIGACSAYDYNWFMNHSHEVTLYCRPSCASPVADPLWDFEPSSRLAMTILNGNDGPWGGDWHFTTWLYFYEGASSGSAEERDAFGSYTDNYACVWSAHADGICRTRTVASGYSLRYGSPAVLGRGVATCGCPDAVEAGSVDEGYWNVENPSHHN